MEAAAAVSAAEAAAAAAALLAFVNDDPCDDDYDGEVLLMSECKDTSVSVGSKSIAKFFFCQMLTQKLLILLHQATHFGLFIRRSLLLLQKYKRKLPILLLVLLQKFLSTPGYLLPLLHHHDFNPQAQLKIRPRVCWNLNICMKLSVLSP